MTNMKQLEHLMYRGEIERAGIVQPAAEETQGGLNQGV